MRRRDFLVIATGAATIRRALAATDAPRRIGYLALSLSASERRTEAFRQRLRDLGYSEGRNLVVEYRDADGKPERFPALATELAALRLDVLVTVGGTAAAVAARQASATVPIVFLGAGDPVQEGLVASLARPGANVTGFSLVAPESIGKWLELLKATVPGLDLVAVLYNPDPMPEGARIARLHELQHSATALGLRIQLVEVRERGDLERSFSLVSNSGAGGLLLLSTPIFQISLRRLAELALKHRLPAVYQFRGFVDAGGLVSYGPDIDDLSRRAAEYVDKILRGAHPGDLPVQQPTKLELVINLKTAKALGLTVPQALLARADEVIE